MRVNGEADLRHDGEPVRAACMGPLHREAVGRTRLRPRLRVAEGQAARAHRRAGEAAAVYLLADRKPLAVEQTADGWVVQLPAVRPSVDLVGAGVGERDGALRGLCGWVVSGGWWVAGSRRHPSPTTHHRCAHIARRVEIRITPFAPREPNTDVAAASLSTSMDSTSRGLRSISAVPPLTCGIPSTTISGSSDERKEREPRMRIEAVPFGELAHLDSREPARRACRRRFGASWSASSPRSPSSPRRPRRACPGSRSRPGRWSDDGSGRAGLVRRGMTRQRTRRRPRRQRSTGRTVRERGAYTWAREPHVRVGAQAPPACCTLYDGVQGSDAQQSRPW